VLEFKIFTGMTQTTKEIFTEQVVPIEKLTWDGSFLRSFLGGTALALPSPNMVELLKEFLDFSD
jgi:hypothetical protein